MKKMKTPDTAKILKILAESNKPVSTALLRKRGNMSYDSVAKRIHDLRADGYDITTVTRKGVAGAKATTYTL